MATRDTILSRLIAATATSSSTPHEWAALTRSYAKAGVRNDANCLALLVERLHDYDAEVTLTAPDDLTRTITTALEKSDRQRFVVPGGLPDTWLVQGFEWRRDDYLTIDAINAADGVVTAASCAIADSGTIALHHGPDEGRRVLSLLPDWHLVILRRSQIVETLPEYFARFEAPRLVTWISGPSATADIEMTRIKGVHGPRHLNVIIVLDRA